MKHLIEYRYYRAAHALDCDHEHRTISGARRCAGRRLPQVEEVWKRNDGRITAVFKMEDK